ncbi:hypothetical protein OEZ86_004430 [Tetradesmus obliquus]|nr:hypothetical protein OEZ86_004430 [Tetradesmus obliquus]
MDVPLVTEATSDFFRNVYADPELGPIFKASKSNMLVLRKHTSYFIHQLAQFECPMTPRQLQYLNKIHGPVITKYHPTQHHFDLMASYLIAAIQEHGAEAKDVLFMQKKLAPLRKLFPPDPQQQQQQQQGPEASDSSGSSSGSGSGGRLTDGPGQGRDAAVLHASSNIYMTPVAFVLLSHCYMAVG